MATVTPLTATSDAVAAYVRRDGNRAVVVVVNLGATPLTGVTISSGNGALPAGRWTTHDLLGESAGAGMRVPGNGRLATWPAGTLAPRQGYVWELRAPR